MKEKYVKYLSIFLYEAYIVCLFLPIQFGTNFKVYGLNVFFAILMEEALPLTFLISLLLLVFPLYGLAVSLKDIKKDTPYYILCSIGAVQFLFFLASGIFGFGKGFGIGVCTAFSLVLCALSAYKIILISNKKQIDNTDNNPYNNAHNCPHCNRLLYGDEQCECQKMLI